MSSDFTDRECAETIVLPEEEDLQIDDDEAEDAGQEGDDGTPERGRRRLSERDADVLGAIGVRADARRREDDEEEGEDEEFGDDDDELELEEEDEELDEEFEEEGDDEADDDDDEVELDDDE